MHEGVATALGGFCTQTQLEEITAVSGIATLPTRSDGPARGALARQL